MAHHEIGMVVVLLILKYGIFSHYKQCADGIYTANIGVYVVFPIDEVHVLLVAAVTSSEMPRRLLIMLSMFQHFNRRRRQEGGEDADEHPVTV